MTRNNENTNAFLIHISSFSGYIIPFGSIIVPIVLWQTLKDRSRYLDAQGKEAVNFNISYGLYIFILGLSIIPSVFGSLFNQLRYNDSNFHFNFGDSNLFFGFFSIASVISIVGILKIALVIIASIKAKDGENYTYPLTIKFIK